MTIEERIGHDIEQAVRSGEWPMGHRLPVEHELAARYRCSRATVSKALAPLARAGLIERRKRAGSFVAAPPVRSAVLDIPDIGAMVEAQGQSYRFDLLSRTVRQIDLAVPDEALLGLAGPALALEGLHLGDGAPFAYERRLIALATVPEAEAAQFAGRSPGGWLLDTVPWTDARHRIRALGAKGWAARHLRLSANAPCLGIERWTWRAGRGVTYVQQVFPADRYLLVSDFRPGALALGPASR